MKRYLAFLAMASACGGSAKVSGRASLGGPALTEEDRSRCDPEGKRAVKMDLNKDQKADVLKLFASRDEGGQAVEYLSCKEVDINFDGRSDVWFYYGDDGNREREEMDLDFDGKIDLVTFRQADKVVRQELDTDFDGKTDIWRYFELEKVSRIERDSDANGKIDYWEYYEGGVLDRIGYDQDGDGKIDRWDRAPPPEVPAGVAPADTKPSTEGLAPESNEEKDDGTENKGKNKNKNKNKGKNKNK